MFSKLRANYSLSNVLVRIFFVLAVVFATWQDMLGAANYYAVSGWSNAIIQMGDTQGVLLRLNGSVKLVIALTSSALCGVVLMFLTPFIAGLFLNISKIYSVPRAEYCLLVNLYCSIGFFACGLLNLINLITPVFMVWGGVIFPFIVTLACFISFYSVTSKLYFNDVTKVHYFKCLLIVAIIVLVLEVI